MQRAGAEQTAGRGRAHGCGVAGRGVQLAYVCTARGRGWGPLLGAGCERGEVHVIAPFLCLSAFHLFLSVCLSACLPPGLSVVRLSACLGAQTVYSTVQRVSGVTGWGLWQGSLASSVAVLEGR